MKRVGRWWVPEYEAKARVLHNIEKEKWQCSSAIEQALEHVRDLGVALDIGTWIGDSTKILAERFKVVVGFEAVPAVFDCCVRNMEEHAPRGNVFMHNIALSDRDGPGYLLNRHTTFAGWVVTKTEHLEDPNVIGVTCRPLDAFSMTGVSFMKIDVDGHESYLLQGAKEFFENNSPIILVEHVDKTRKLQAPTKPAEDVLRQLGYKQVAQITRMDYLYVRK